MSCWETFLPLQMLRRMNKIIFWVLKILKPLWKKLGADADQLLAILKVKLILDDRKPIATWNTMSQKSAKKKGNRFTTVFIFFAALMMGFIFLIPVILFKNPYLGLTGYFSIFTLYLTLSLVTDFSRLLIDTKEKYILFPKPITGRTLFLARIIHMTIYLWRIIFPMSLLGWIFIAFKMGWVIALWLPVGVMLMSITALFFVMGIYILILKIASPTKFKSLLNGLQIVFSIFIFGSYMLIPRLLDRVEIIDPKPENIKWILALPPYWIASTFSWWGQIKESLPLGNRVLGLAAFVFPLLLLWVTVKYLAVTFINKMSDLDAVQSVPSNEPLNPLKKNVREKDSWAKRLSILLNKESGGRAGFFIAWIQTGRSRMFKMRMYPAFAYVPLYFVYIIFMQNKSSLSEIWAYLPETKSYLTLLYMSAFVVLQAANYLTYSDQFKAAWVYQLSFTPLPGTIMGGAFKAMMVKYMLPFFLFISAIVISIWGYGVIIDVLLAGVNITFYTLLLSRVSNRYLPFSRIEQMKNSVGKTFL